MSFTAWHIINELEENMKSSKIITVDYTKADNEEARSLIQTGVLNSDKYDIFQFSQFEKEENPYIEAQK